MDTSRLPKSPIPPVIPVRQRFDRPQVHDLTAATAAALAQMIPDPRTVKGKVIGLTAPSRGIHDTGINNPTAEIGQRARSTNVAIRLRRIRLCQEHHDRFKPLHSQEE